MQPIEDTRFGLVFVSASVLLETECVLRGAYGLARMEVVRLLRDFLSLPDVSIEDPAMIAQAGDDCPSA
jgi:hypothetical protein